MLVQRVAQTVGRRACGQGFAQTEPRTTEPPKVRSYGLTESQIPERRTPNPVRWCRWRWALSLLNLVLLAMGSPVVAHMPRHGDSLPARVSGA